MRVEQHHQLAGGEATPWSRQDYSAASDVVRLASLAIEMALAGIYAGVTPLQPS